MMIIFWYRKYVKNLRMLFYQLNVTASPLKNISLNNRGFREISSPLRNTFSDPVSSII